MYQLVQIVGGKEFVIANSPDRKEIELKKEYHVRTGSLGVVEIREVKDEKK